MLHPNFNNSVVTPPCPPFLSMIEVGERKWENEENEKNEIQIELQLIGYPKSEAWEGSPKFQHSSRDAS